MQAAPDVSAASARSPGAGVEVVFVSPFLGRGSSFGGGRVSMALLDVVRHARPGAVVSVSIGASRGVADEVVPGSASRLQTALYNFLGYSATLTPPSAARILHRIETLRPATVWLDSSMIGRLAGPIRKRLPNVRILTFFQNIEFDVQKARVRRENVLYLPSCASDWLNERLTLKHADVVMMLTEADSLRSKSLYGRAADFIVPVSLPDTAPAGVARSGATATGSDAYLLFVGTVYGPNLEAARFIADELASRLPPGLRVVIAGRGLETYADSLSRSNVTVLGGVDDLAPLYAGASFVLAPVFSGGGMKVKIAEALMHGRRVLASPFAAIGYEKSVRSGGTVVCNGVDDYVAMCARLPDAAESPARSDYESYYSIEASAALMNRILQVSAGDTN